MIPSLIWVFCLIRLVAANTETIVFLVPNYYDIPLQPHVFSGQNLVSINSTTNALTEFPILDVYNYNLLQTLVSVPYDFAAQRSNRLLVKLNNYGDSTFDANDLINVKLCWPATTPVNFRLDHKFVRSGDLGLAEKLLPQDTLDIYVEIQYQADFYAVREFLPPQLEFNLVISKLPNRVPIPIELYDFIMYFGDVCIVLVALYPYIISALKRAYF